MKKTILSAILILCAMAHTQGAWAVPTKEQSSCTSPKEFVQSFYNWYVIKTDNRPDIRGTETALKEKKQLLEGTLYKELMKDEEAAAKAQGDLVGLDFDPFVNANGLIYDKYETGAAVTTGATYRVPIYGIQSGKKTPKPVVEAEVGIKNGRCVFTNFHYGKSKFPQNENLLSVLHALEKERQKGGQ